MMAAALYAENPTMFRDHPFAFILALLLIAAFGLGILILAVWYLNCKATKLTIFEHEVLMEKGLLSKNRTELAMRYVRTVKVYQSLMDRIFGVGKVEIFTAGDQPEIMVRGMPNPHVIRDLIKQDLDAHARPD